MSIRRYAIVEPSTVEDFTQHLYEAARSSSYLVVQAVEVADELSLRRSGGQQQLEFTFRIIRIHTDPRDLAAEVQVVDTNEWSLISVNAETITFELVS